MLQLSNYTLRRHHSSSLTQHCNILRKDILYTNKSSVDKLITPKGSRSLGSCHQRFRPSVSAELRAISAARSALYGSQKASLTKGMTLTPSKKSRRTLKKSTACPKATSTLSSTSEKRKLQTKGKLTKFLEVKSDDLGV